MRREKSLRIGVHQANDVVWGPVYRTRLSATFDGATDNISRTLDFRGGDAQSRRGHSERAGSTTTKRGVGAGVGVGVERVDFVVGVRRSSGRRGGEAAIGRIDERCLLCFGTRSSGRRPSPRDRARRGRAAPRASSSSSSPRPRATTRARGE